MSVLAGLIVILGMESTPRNREMWLFAAMFLLISFFVQGIALGIWATAGDKPTPWRFVCIVAAIVAILYLRNIPGFGFISEIEKLAVSVLFVVVATSLPLFMVRVTGIRLEHVSRDASSSPARVVRPEEGLSRIDGAVEEPPKLQFSLWSLMSWTTALAVLLSTLSTLHVVMPFGTVEWLAVATGFAVSSPMVLLAAWIVLVDEWLGARIAVLGLAIWAVWLFAVLGGGDQSGWLFLLCMVAIAVVIGPFFLFRLAGYRLVRRQSAVWNMIFGTRRRI